MKDNTIRKVIMRIKNHRRATLQADTSLISAFVGRNKEVWKPKEKSDTGKFCYIVNWQPRELASIIPQLVFAQGLAKSNPVEILVFSPQVDKAWEEFNESFGTKQTVVKKRITDKMYGLFKVLQLTLKREKGIDLLHVCYNGIPLGEFLYDYIVRMTEDQYTIDRVRFKNRKIIYNFFSTISCVYHMFMEKRPEFYMPFERCHLEGALAIVASYFGAKIIQCTASGRIIYLGEGKNAKIRWQDLQKKVVEEFMKKEITTDFVKSAEEYLQMRFAAKGNLDVDVVNAFMDKKVITRSEFVEKAGLDKHKKNIVIMLHVFSDEPHGSEFLLFQDYYIWYKETMKMIQDIKNVNWIVKAHPSRKMYGEDKEAYNVFLKYKQENIVWFSDEYSTASLVEIADAIITVQGTAGTEFSCLGKPVILCGRAFYSGFGFTIEPKTIHEYQHFLKHMDKIQSLSEEEREKACKMMYVCLRLEGKPYDDFDEMLTESYKMETKQGNNIVLESLYRMLSEHSYYYFNTKFFNAGEQLGKEINHLPIGAMIYREEVLTDKLQ